MLLYPTTPSVFPTKPGRNNTDADALSRIQWPEAFDISSQTVLALKWAITDKFHEYLYGAEFQVFTDNNPLTYILTTTKLHAAGHRWVAALSNYTFSISYKPGRNNTDADALSRIQWPEAVDNSSQTVHAVCEGVQAPHGKIETLCHGAQAVGVLLQDTMPSGMTSLEWSQAQMTDPAICQIIQAITK